MTPTTSQDGQAHAGPAQPSVAAAATAAGYGPGSGHGMASMVMLCVAMLAAAALTLLVLLVSRVRSGRCCRPRSSPPLCGPSCRPWVRGTGPPEVWRFSVIRC